jgi:D-glycero-D-manno-heptose 1,7-bisphosphate phosphatase
MATSRRGAVFLDRDGTIIRQVELLHEVERMRILPGAAQAIKLFNEAALRVVVVTNQPVVARGLSTEADVRKLHDVLNLRLKKQKAHVDTFYFCPHHPNATLEGYRQACECRKPNPGMILQAAAEHGIDLSSSVMIGDTTQDILTGKRAGVKTILVRTGHGGRDPWQYDCVPDMTAANLMEAANLWLTRIGL